MADISSILVFGAGAIGTYVGGSLALAGQHVTFIEQPKAVEELRQRGLRLELINAKKEKKQATITSFGCAASLAEALKHGPYDFAISALKSFDTAAALEGMKPFVDQLPPILCLQNGVDNEPDLAVVLGKEKIIPGTVTSSVGRRGVGDIVLERLRGIGLADGHPLSLFVWRALQMAALNPRLYPRPLDMKWSKMLTNLPANASAAILDMTAAEVFDHPGLFHLEMQMLREALTVMKAQGIRVVDLPGTPTRMLALGIRLPAFISRPLLRKAVGGGRGGKMPSFHIDLHSGRGRSEVEWLNGAVVRHGNEHSVPTPVNRMLTETLSALTRSDVALSDFSRQPEKLLAKMRNSK
jgi:2-dehydropantoate 2-reductase